jgi:hypothetical protein
MRKHGIDSAAPQCLSFLMSIQTPEQDRNEQGRWYYFAKGGADD